MRDKKDGDMTEPRREAVGGSLAGSGDPRGQADEELDALARIVQAMRNYRVDAEVEIGRWEEAWDSLSPDSRALTSHVPAKIKAARLGVLRNDLFLKAVLREVLGDEGEEMSVPWERCEGGDGAGGRGEVAVDGRARGAADAPSAASGARPAALPPSPAPPPHVPPLLAAAPRAATLRALRGEPVSPDDSEKVRYILKNTARDFSAEMAGERAASYGRVVDEVVSWAPPGSRVLVPGHGLGRLSADLAAHGFEVVGNEFSYFMALTGDFLLNSCGLAGQWTLHPWVLDVSNVRADADQLRGLRVPDAPTTPERLRDALGRWGSTYGGPGRLDARDGDDGPRHDHRRDPRGHDHGRGRGREPHGHGHGRERVRGHGRGRDVDSQGGRGPVGGSADEAGSARPLSPPRPPAPSLQAILGDFVEIFSPAPEAGAFDVVTTCFFLDAIPNPLDAARTIYHVLRPGGRWVNLGPLLYHWAGSGPGTPAPPAGQIAFELSLEALLEALCKLGFSIDRHTTVTAQFAGNPRSMIRTEYDCSFFTATKLA